MSRKKKGKKRRYRQVREQISSPPVVPKTSPRPANERVTAPKRRWASGVLIATIATLLAAAIAASTRIFEAKLRVINLPAVVNQMGVVGSNSSARHLVHVHFCVENDGLQSGSVSALSFSAVGLPKIPNVEVQDLDRTPISFLSKRSVTAKLLVEDQMSTPEKARMKLDVMGESGQWIGGFEIDVTRPWKFEKKPDGSTTGTAVVTVSERSLDACARA